MKTILITGIGGLTPRSIAKTIRKNHPNYRLIGCDIEKKAVGFFMRGLLDEYYVCPRCTSPDYFPWIEKLVADKGVDYAFVQPESEIVEGGGLSTLRRRVERSGGTMTVDSFPAFRLTVTIPKKKEGLL